MNLRRCCGEVDASQVDEWKTAYQAAILNARFSRLIIILSMIIRWFKSYVFSSKSLDTFTSLFQIESRCSLPCSILKFVKLGSHAHAFSNNNFSHLRQHSLASSIFKLCLIVQFSVKHHITSQSKILTQCRPRKPPPKRRPQLRQRRRQLLKHHRR